MTDDERRALVVENMRLGYALAKRYRGRGLDPEDLDGAAMVALCEAAARFDPDRLPREKFGAFAQYHINGDLRRLTNRERRRRTVEVALLMSMEPPADPPRDADGAELDELVRDALGMLDARQARAVRLRFGFDGSGGHTLFEVACRMNVSTATVKRLLSSAARVIAFALKSRGWDGESWADAMPDVPIRMNQSVARRA